MAVVADWIELVGNTSIIVNAVSGADGVPVPLNGNSFNAGMRETNVTGLLMFSVRDLLGSARVLLNGNEIGTVTKSAPGFWSTQLISFSGSELNEFTNHLVLKSVTDQFSLKNVVCFFHQRT